MRLQLVVKLFNYYNDFPDSHGSNFVKNYSIQEKPTITAKKIRDFDERHTTTRQLPFNTSLAMLFSIKLSRHK